MITENLFFIIGPLRTGSSLMSRCLDDHPESICLCESEINRALIRDYFTILHFNRMRHHGLTPDNTVKLLNRRRQDSIESLMDWYRDSQDQFTGLYNKSTIKAYGDKSPDFFTSSELVHHMAANHRLIYTVRDPRAIYRSIMVQQDSSPKDKANRWVDFARNFIAWEPWLEQSNILSVRYEDLVRAPESTMDAVYAHLGLEPTRRFLEPFSRAFPKRFLWETAVDWANGVRRDFDSSRIDRWKAELTSFDVKAITADETVRRFMKRFRYE